MTVHILVEGDSDEEILKAILPETGKTVRYWRSRGRGSMLSLARSLLTSMEGPVAVVLDADTTQSALVEERRTNARKLLELAGDEGDAWSLVVFVPEIEELLLRDASVLRTLRTSQEAMKRRDKHERSRDVFRRLLSRSNQRMQAWLEVNDLTHLRTQSPVDDLVKFLRAKGIRIRDLKSTKSTGVARGRS